MPHSGNSLIPSIDDSKNAAYTYSSSKSRFIRSRRNSIQMERVQTDIEEMDMHSDKLRGPEGGRKTRFLRGAVLKT